MTRRLDERFTRCAWCRLDLPESGCVYFTFLERRAHQGACSDNVAGLLRTNDRSERGRNRSKAEVERLLAERPSATPA